MTTDGVRKKFSNLDGDIIREFLQTRLHTSSNQHKLNIEDWRHVRSSTQKSKVNLKQCSPSPEVLLSSTNQVDASAMEAKPTTAVARTAQHTKQCCVKIGHYSQLNFVDRPYHLATLATEDLRLTQSAPLSSTLSS